MKTILFTISILIAAIVPLSVGAETYTMKTGQFSKLKVVDNANVIYRCHPDSTGMIQFSGDKQFADAFIAGVKNGTLKIQVSTEDVDHPDLPTLFVYSDFLEAAENSGNLSVTIENPAPCPSFEIKEIGNGSISAENVKANVVKASLTTGNGSVIVSGKCRQADIKMVGTGVISTDRLEAEIVKCSILGSGSIGCWPTEQLSVKGIGSTKIYYKGNPEVKKTGGGKIYELPEGQPLDKAISNPDGTPDWEVTEND